MSVVSSTLAPAVAPAANAASQTSGSVGRGAEGTNLSSNAQASLASQSAATVVSLSGDGKSRSASSGEGRKVDSTFDKQEAQGKSSDKRGKSGKGVSGSLDVSA